MTFHVKPSEGCGLRPEGMFPVTSRGADEVEGAPAQALAGGLVLDTFHVKPLRIGPGVAGLAQEGALWGEGAEDVAAQSVGGFDGAGGDGVGGTGEGDAGEFPVADGDAGQLESGDSGLEESDLFLGPFEEEEVPLGEQEGEGDGGEPGAASDIEEEPTLGCEGVDEGCEGEGIGDVAFDELFEVAGGDEGDGGIPLADEVLVGIELIHGVRGQGCGRMEEEIDDPGALESGECGIFIVLHSFSLH